MFGFLRSKNKFKEMINEMAKELGIKQDARGKNGQDVTQLAEEFGKELGLKQKRTPAGQKDLVKEVMTEAGKELGITENTTSTNMSSDQLAQRINEEIQKRKKSR
ncbi:hypothetical protein C1X05_11610 [Laceyella sacchari]|jgi:hypothetical protein|uniref:Uncharacterized protein n=1 Tax=Laceyella tengchongensis TaxID=574699 RepID=A0AA45WLK7_9BACL|nr:hypothetical protein [Laceyella tengchongensis]AUS09397.1 hypothetical protein C1X05_11610 [Laceyella sacchari]SMP11778.1 hypothetical protein SAMN06265361_102286 [Laceyella tengchongensis]